MIADISNGKVTDKSWDCIKLNSGTQKINAKWLNGADKILGSKSAKVNYHCKINVTLHLIHCKRRLMNNHTFI